MSEENKTDWKAEHYKLQVRLDEEIQKHEDTKAAHQAEVDAKMKAAHEKLASVVDDHAEAIAAKDSELANVNQSHNDGLIALAQKHADELAQQKAHLQGAHAEHVAQLKQAFLVPAQRDLHARQLADLAAKHKAEIEALAKG